MTGDAPPSAFQWNVGGWFGGQLGGTVWMVAAALVLIPIDLGVAALTLGIFAVPNVLGILLWRRRARIRVYPAMQLLIAVIGVCAVVLFVLWNRLGQDQLLEALQLKSPGPGYWWLLVFPGLMLFFYLRERSARRDPGREDLPLDDAP